MWGEAPSPTSTGSMNPDFIILIMCCPTQDAERRGLHWISLQSKRSPQTVSVCLLCLRLRDKGEMENGEIEKKERVGAA